MQMVVQGVSTRRVKEITDRLCGRRFARSTVSELAKGLEEQVEAWAERPLGVCPFLICDAMQVKVRRQEAVRATTVLLAVGVTDEGQREILGLEVALEETLPGRLRLSESSQHTGSDGTDLRAPVSRREAAKRRGKPPSHRRVPASRRVVRASSQTQTCRRKIFGQRLTLPWVS
jgi:hypothetical protein